MALLQRYRSGMMIILAVVVELCFYSSNSHSLTCHPRDLDALRDFINELSPKPDSWEFTSTGDCCEWEGITCNSLRVTKLKLVSKTLSGKLSESLGKLHHLRVLNLSSNFISGSIPPSIFNLTNLEALDLSFNGFTGLIPESLNLPSLKSLSFSSNQLNGSLPVHICRNSTDLTLIRLESNRFSGEFLSGFEKCSLLQHLFLSGNGLAGNIPEDLFHLQRLSLFEVQENGLSGTLSSALGNLSSLVHLDISMNRFSGEIPNVFKKLSKLEYLVARSNQFTGGIPMSLANSKTLSLLNLGNNSLSGPLHLNCTVMTNLASLDLGVNRFNGSLPEHLPSCRQLTHVNLARNHFDGQVPESFKDFHSLSYLGLSNCSLVNISSTLHILQHCKNLTNLVLTLNFYGEMLPDDPSLHFKNLKAYRFNAKVVEQEH
ncbi:Phytosulfokine receptor 1 [Raphanus sativus]|nr:Phytosulfokine receptor 1 [Raphanus sativus]